jgi:hypothetical protein
LIPIEKEVAQQERRALAGEPRQRKLIKERLTCTKEPYFQQTGLPSPPRWGTDYRSTTLTCYVVIEPVVNPDGNCGSIIAGLGEDVKNR